MSKKTKSNTVAERPSIHRRIDVVIKELIEIERERCISIMRKWLQFESQRAVSWHEVEDAIEEIRKPAP